MVRSFSLSRDDDVVVTCSEFFPVSHALPTALSRNAPQLWVSISGRAEVYAPPSPLRLHVLLFHVRTRMRRRGLAPSCLPEACHLRYGHGFQRAARSASWRQSEESGGRRIHSEIDRLRGERGGKVFLAPQRPGIVGGWRIRSLLGLHARIRR